MRRLVYAEGESMSKVIVEVDMAKYKSVDMPAQDAIKLLEKIAEITGKMTPDMQETIRYIRNFDEFYEYMRKKFKDYIAPPHRPDDYIKGNAVIDKVKLYKRDKEKHVVIIFDRRVSVEAIVEALKGLGYDVEIKKAF